MQSVVDEINVDVELQQQQPQQQSSTEDQPDQGDADFGGGSGNGLKYLPKWPPVNIDFQDVTYSVPDLAGELS